ncbi:hypothetical protein ACJX0J_029973, partial [Zea mays]
ETNHLGIIDVVFLTSALLFDYFVIYDHRYFRILIIVPLSIHIKHECLLSSICQCLDCSHLMLMLVVPRGFLALVYQGLPADKKSKNHMFGEVREYLFSIRKLTGLLKTAHFNILSLPFNMR